MGVVGILDWSLMPILFVWCRSTALLIFAYQQY